MTILLSMPPSELAERQALAAALFDVAHLTGKFLLRSGAHASEYFDKYQFECRPDLLRRLVRAMVALVPTGTEVLAGLELGGVPVATALSLETGIPAVFVRKQAKAYGTCRLAEGVEVSGRRVLVVEDVVTSGGQVVLSTADLRAAGAVVNEAVVVIDRRPVGAEGIEKAGIRVSSLFTGDELREAGGLTA